MKALEQKLIVKISEILDNVTEDDVPVLDILCRLLGTVENTIVAKKQIH